MKYLPPELQTKFGKLIENDEFKDYFMSIELEKRGYLTKELCDTAGPRPDLFSSARKEMERLAQLNSINLLTEDVVIGRGCKRRSVIIYTYVGKPLSSITNVKLAGEVLYDLLNGKSMILSVNLGSALYSLQQWYSCTLVIGYTWILARQT